MASASAGLSTSRFERRLVFGEVVIRYEKAQIQMLPKRIVSKAEYARVQARYVRQSVQSVPFLIMGFACINTAFAAALILVFSPRHHHMSNGFLFCTTLFCTALGYMLLKVGFVTKRKVESENVDIAPLTRANIADLPASESLVRASGAPMQEQETALLRAAPRCSALQITSRTSTKNNY